MLGALLLGLNAQAQPVDLFGDTPGLAWSEVELQALAAPGWHSVVERAGQRSLLGCATHCEQIQRVFQRLQQTAAALPGRAGQLSWRLSVVRLPDVEAFVTPDGDLVLSEDFVSERQLDDAMLAFVLGHEMAHSILQHERQALTSVLALLPKGVDRTAQDVVTELDYNGSVRALASPLFQQTESDADEHGLLLAAAAGYAPEQALEFMRAQARQPDFARSIFATHPPAAARLTGLQQRLPLARAVWLKSVVQPGQ